MFMKSIIFPLYALLWLCAFSFGNEDDRTKVEFFEKLYKTKITGVKLLEEYPDPDQFYSAIAKQVGIPQIVCKAVEEKFGWKNDGKSFLSLMIKGGGNSDDWGVKVTKIPSSMKKLKVTSRMRRREKKVYFRGLSFLKWKLKWWWDMMGNFISRNRRKVREKDLGKWNS